LLSKIHKKLTDQYLYPCKEHLPQNKNETTGYVAWASMLKQLNKSEFSWPM